MRDPRSFRRRLTMRLVGAASAVSFAANGGACDAQSPHGVGGHAVGGAGGASRSSSSRAASSSSSGRPMGTPCAGTFDCPCWQCTCAGAAPVLGRACTDGVCPDGPDVCAPVCAGLDGGVDGGSGGGPGARFDSATTVICPDVAAGGSGGGSAMPSVQACFPIPDAGECPTNWGVALNDFLALGCPTGYEPFQILAGPVAQDAGADAGDDCCYSVHNILCGAGGRPYREDGAARVATVRRHGGDGSPVSRAAADAWTVEALAEHASVASFARFAVALLSVGAPPDLVAAAHEAALDEIRHAHLAFGFASRFAGHVVEPGPFPTGPRVSIDATLVELAVSTVIDGCVSETVAAVAASERARRAADPAIRAALEEIAEDEARHAELAWRTVAWAVRVGGDPVRQACAAALQRALAETGAPSTEESAVVDELERAGIPSARLLASAISSAKAEVIGPVARALFSRVQTARFTEVQA